MRVVALLLLSLLEPCPSRARCPAGWSVSNLKPDGGYSCDAPLPRGCGEPDAASPPCPRPPSKAGRIYCTGGAVPVTDYDGRAVGCQR